MGRLGVLREERAGPLASFLRAAEGHERVDTQDLALLGKRSVREAPRMLVDEL
jgi:hypothetical protein